MHRHRRLALLSLAIAAPVAPEESGVVPASTESGKHIDWYCGECDPRYLNSSYPTSRPDLLDGIMPCCNLLEIDCSTGTVNVSRHNFSGYAPWLEAGKTVNIDLSGGAECCTSETDCKILENKEQFAAQVRL